jgi:hypothetical protein
MPFTHTGFCGVVTNIPFLMDQKVDYQKIKEKTAKPTQTSPVIQGLHQNVELSAGNLQSGKQLRKLAVPANLG